MTAIAWGAKVSRAFVEKVVAIAAEIGIPPDWPMAWMAFETGETFSPKIRNAGTGVATGLIQFMPQIARDLGTSTSALALMTAVEQLDYVRAYFKSWRGKIHSIDDGYMVILWPAAVGKPDSYVLFDRDNEHLRRAYLENAGLDANHDGKITKAEAAAKVREKLRRGQLLFAGEGNDAPATDAADDLAADMAEATQPARLLSETEVRGAQEILRALNYNPGMPGVGGIGSFTIGAIAAFKHDRGLAGEPVLDRALIAELEAAQREGWSRPISQERASGEPEGSRIVASSERQATATGVVAGGGVLAGIAQTAHEKLDWLQSFAEPFLPYLKPVAHLVAEYWWAFLGAAGVYLLAEQGRTWWARIQDYRQGKTT